MMNGNKKVKNKLAERRRKKRKPRKPLASYYGDPKKVTRGDVIAAAIENKA